MSRRGRGEAQPLVTGVVAVDKPAGITSHDVVQRVRRAIGQRQVGHTGTLDPAATGVMVVTLGRATRIGRYLEAGEKEYLGTVHLGRSTTTYDAEGTVVEDEPVPPLMEDAVARCLSSFIGEVEQEVPAFSAVKVEGERLYRRARKGESVELPRRTVTIHAIELQRFAPPEIDFRVQVSKGTYIRSLAVQIGRALGAPAHLSRLVRTRVGRFTRADAVGVDDGAALRAAVFRMADALADYPALKVDDRASCDVRHGRPLTAGQLAAEWSRGWTVRTGPETPIRVLDQSGTLIAMARFDDSPRRLAAGPPEARALRYDCVLAVNSSS